MGSTWQSFHFLCDWEMKIEFSKTRQRIYLSWHLQNSYPPEGVCSQTPNVRVQLNTLSILLGYERYIGFQIPIWFIAFFFLRKCFVPWREMRTISSRGPIVFTYVLFWVRKWTFKNNKVTEVMYFGRAFSSKCFIWWDGWDGLDGISKVCFNFFHFKLI